MLKQEPVGHYHLIYDDMRNLRICMIKTFMGGRGGGGGGSSERCLKWIGGGSLIDLSKNILKQGVGKDECCS